MGYNLYAYSSQRVDGGALIQALGTRSSDLLVPRVQRLRFDEDFLLLLCSDGLSDFDRVEQLWRSHIHPALSENLSLSGTCKNLIEQANKLNGHDNVTIALIRGRLAPPDPNEEAPTIETQIPRAAIASTSDITAADVSANPDKSNRPKSGALVAAGKKSNPDDNDPEDDDDPIYDPESAEATTVVTRRKTSPGLLITFLLLVLILGTGLAAVVPESNRWLSQQFPWLEKYLKLVPGKQVEPSGSPAPSEDAEEPTESNQEPGEAEPTPTRSPGSDSTNQANPDRESDAEPDSNQTSPDNSGNDSSSSDRNGNQTAKPGGDSIETDVINTEDIADPVKI
jgi:hypothetical protein